MFKCYDSSFDKIIEEEVNQFKFQLKAQESTKDDLLKRKDREL
jgi:hypothetical protein